MKTAFLSLASAMARILPMRIKRALYQNGPLARVIRRGLNAAAPQGLSEITVAAGALVGMRLALDLQEEKDYWLGTYEPELQNISADLVQPGMVIYDVGANIGYISLLFARRAGEEGRVFSFEALPRNVERLARNLALNTAGRRVTPVPRAVTGKSGEVTFLVGPSGGMGKAEGSAGRQNITYSASLTVPAVSLDDFVFGERNPVPALVKMDIEGGEVMALPGMARLLREARPILLMELHGPESACAAWESLGAAHYRICRMEPGCPPVASLEELNWKAYLVGLPQ